MEDGILIGKWKEADSGVVGDDPCKRIEAMVPSFKKVATRENGWTTLFYDPEQGAYWDLRYPESELPGGGPPALAQISVDDVSLLYPSLMRGLPSRSA